MVWPLHSNYAFYLFWVTRQNSPLIPSPQVPRIMAVSVERVWSSWLTLRFFSEFGVFQQVWGFPSEYGVCERLWALNESSMVLVEFGVREGVRSS